MIRAPSKHQTQGADEATLFEQNQTPSLGPEMMDALINLHKTNVDDKNAKK
jgi:hypothetical protein